MNRNMKCAPVLYGSCRTIHQNCVMVFMGTKIGEPARDSRVLHWDGGGSVGGVLWGLISFQKDKRIEGL